MKKLFLIGLLGLSVTANAEFVTNANGDRVELKANGTWSIVKLTDDDFVLNSQYYDVTLKDGNKQEVKVNVLPNINLKDGQKLTKARALFGIKMTEISIPYQLKNPYSYVPKKVYIYQDGSLIKITIEYIARNSYGADTVGTHTGNFTMDQKGEIHIVHDRI